MFASTLRRATPIALVLSVVLILTTLASGASAGVAPCKVRNIDSDVLYTDLQSAINDATADDVLRIKGICVGNFLINKSLRLRGAAGGNPGVLDGNDAGRTVDVPSSTVTVTLRRLTITGGALDEAKGAGIRNEGTLTIRNSTITDNHATGGLGEGGGFENGCSGSLTVTGSTISGNTASKGGGVHVGCGTVTLNNTQVTGNTSSGTGGGVDINVGTLTLNDSTITGNTAGTCGGGVLNGGGTLNVLGTSSISGNTPDDVVNGVVCP